LIKLRYICRGIRIIATNKLRKSPFTVLLRMIPIAHSTRV